MVTKQVGPQTAQARLLAMAGRLFHDFEELPVRTVFQAMGAARMELRERKEGVVTPEEIEGLARRRLLATPPPGPPARVSEGLTDRRGRPG